MMWRFLIFAVLGYYLFRNIKRLFQPRSPEQQVRSKQPPKSQESHKLKNVEDADFEDIE